MAICNYLDLRIRHKSRCQIFYIVFCSRDNKRKPKHATHFILYKVDEKFLSANDTVLKWLYEWREHWMAKDPGRWSYLSGVRYVQDDIAINVRDCTLAVS